MSRLFMGLLLGAATAIALQQIRGRSDKQQSPPQRAAAPPATEDPHVKEPNDPASLTAAELYRRAQAAAIRGRAAMTKAQLIEALRAASE